MQGMQTAATETSTPVHRENEAIKTAIIDSTCKADQTVVYRVVKMLFHALKWVSGRDDRVGVSIGLV